MRLFTGDVDGTHAECERMVLCGRESGFAHEGEHRFALRHRSDAFGQIAVGAHVAAYDTPRQGMIWRV